MGLEKTTVFNILTYSIIFSMLIIYILMQVLTFRKYKQYQQQITKTKYEQYAIPTGYGYIKYLYKNSVFSYLDQYLSSKQGIQIVTSGDQQSVESELTNPIVHSSKLSNKGIQENQITQRNKLSDSQEDNENNNGQVQETLPNQNQLITTNPAGQNADNIPEESQLTSSDDDDDESDDDEEFDDDDQYGYDENGHLKENPKGKKIKYKKSRSLLTGYQTFITFWIFNAFSLPVFCLILLIRDFTIDYMAVEIILSLLSLIPSFTVTISIVFFACIVQNQGIFLKLKDEQQLGESKIQIRDGNSEGESVEYNNNNNTKNKEKNEGERKIFVKHSLKRGMITGFVFALIQCGILIVNFCLGKYDPKLIMMNPLLILIKSINFLHIYFTKQLSYSNKKIQTQQILYQYYQNFYTKHFDFDDLYKEFLVSQKQIQNSNQSNSPSKRRTNENIQNNQNTMREFRQFLESKSYLALVDFRQKELNIQNQLLRDIISNQGLKAQLQLQIFSSLLLFILPLVLFVISLISSFSLISKKEFNTGSQQMSEEYEVYKNRQFFQTPSYINGENNNNVCSVLFNIILILEYLILLRIKYLLNIKVILNTTRDPKKID